MAIILDEIWRLRNHVLYNGDHVDVLQIILHILSKVSEISTISAPAAPPPPPLNWVKSNTDAALSTSNAAIAAVARDFKGEVIKVWTKLLHLCSPIQVEASAILWAVELAAKEHWDCVIFEGDAKACYDPLSSNITHD